MPKVPVMWGEWRPDLATLDTQFAQDVENVFPGSNSYLPVPELASFSDAAIPPPPLFDNCVGLTAARMTTGEWQVYGGTATKLYKWTLHGWTDVSRTTGGAYHVDASEEKWSFAQFGKYLFAVQSGDVMQRIDVDAGTNFEDSPGSPPLARSVRTIGDFLILSGLVSNRRKMIWSGINDPFGWVPGINLCDEQEMPDGGPIMGVAGDKIGYIVQDRAIRLMQFLPGDTTFIFSFSKVVYDRGSISPYGFNSIGDTLYVLCHDGFYALSGATLISIGHEKVNEFFLANSDIGRRNLVQAFAAVRPFIGWAYHSSSGTPDRYYDRVIIFNWNNQRWAKWNINAQIWSSSALSTINLDLDTDGTEPGDPLLDSTARSLDSFAYQGGFPRTAAVDPAGFLSDLAGPNLQAMLETGEAHLSPGNRVMVGDVYPLADGADGVIYNGTRERLQDDVVWGSACPIEITGSAAVYSSARLHRFRHIIPRGTVWTHAQGVVADAQQDGTVA
jgi:hypothetical protein